MKPRNSGRSNALEVRFHGVRRSFRGWAAGEGGLGRQPEGERRGRGGGGRGWLGRGEGGEGGGGAERRGWGSVMGGGGEGRGEDAAGWRGLRMGSARMCARGGSICCGWRCC